MAPRTLDGFVIGVTADRRWQEQAELLERRGATVLHGPTIATAYLANDAALREATERVIVESPDYLVATTGMGMRAWFESARAWDLTDPLLAALASARVIARGPKASAALQTANLDVWATSATERLDDVLATLLEQPLQDRTIAFQHDGARNSVAVDALVDRGARVLEVPVYRWQLPDDTRPAQRLIALACAHELAAVTFTSAPAVHNMVDIARSDGADTALLDAFNSGAVVAACVGPACADGARKAGITAPLAPSVGRLGLLVRALTDTLHSAGHE